MDEMMGYFDEITALKGVGDKTAALFHKVGVYSLLDLISYYPRDYEFFEAPVKIAECKTQTECSIEAVLSGRIETRRMKKLTLLSAFAKDDSGGISLVWFHMPYLKNTLKSGQRYIFHGTVKAKGDHYEMEHPRIFSPQEYEELKNNLVPIYKTTKGLTSRNISRLVRQVIALMDCPEDYIAEQIRSEWNLISYKQAIHGIHFPKNKDELVLARRRLVFDEFFIFLLAVRSMKERNAAEENHFPMRETDEISKLLKKLPYELTGAQKTTWQEIKENLMGKDAMNRLVQGDVGSGKTIIAFMALIMTACNHYQGALMVPTEVLAAQHEKALLQLILENGFDIRVILLTGSMTAKEKRAAYEEIESGKADIIIGTHALIQEKVNYAALGLVVTDEQHRFGVKQRDTFTRKGLCPHVLVMSATPIPRTLAIIIYGDLDISVIHELPASRLPIKNCVVDTSYEAKAFDFIKKETQAGRQAYVICPLVEESENLEAENVLEYAIKMEEFLPANIIVSCLHGKMNPKEKNDIMELFARNEVQVLVSTTVVEVGVNVPNATVMMIVNAERFGLAQLHQLRGRVGRGQYQSYCIFVAGNKSEQTKKRLDILNKTNDGFQIASEDLKMRGPGDLFGFRQSGMMDFKIGDIYTDADILQLACEFADHFDVKGSAVMRERLQEFQKHQFDRIRL